MIVTQILGVLVALVLVACGSSCPRTPDGPVVHDGPVEQGSIEAPGTLPLGAACGPAEGACDETGYCAFPETAACGDGGVAGVCTERPRGCHKDCPGVCGCDGMRYCNACAAKGRGHSVRHPGACVSP